MCYRTSTVQLVVVVAVVVLVVLVVDTLLWVLPKAEQRIHGRRIIACSLQYIDIIPPKLQQMPAGR